MLEHLKNGLLTVGHYVLNYTTVDLVKDLVASGKHLLGGLLG